MQNALVKTTPQSLQKLSRALAITEKLLEDDNPLGLPELIPYRKRHKWGFCNRKKEIVIACEYDSVELFAEGLAVVGREQKSILKYGFIDKRGNEVIPLIYEKVYSFSEGLARVSNPERASSHRYGYINKNGDVMVPCVYDDGYGEKDWKKYHYFSDGLARVSMEGKDGVIDRFGNIIVPFIYEYIGPFKEGLAIVVKDGKYGFIDKLGNVIIPLIYKLSFQTKFSDLDRHGFSEGLACVRGHGGDGFIDKNGRVIIPFQYQGAKSFSEGLACVSVCNFNRELKFKYGFIDKTGNVIIPIIYDGAFSFSEGLAKVKEGHYWGFVDLKGNIVIPFEYYRRSIANEFATDFSEGLTRVQTYFGSPNNFYINKLGNTVIPNLYVHTDDFKMGLARVSKGHGYVYIDKNGTEFYEW